MLNRHPVPDADFGWIVARGGTNYKMFGGLLLYKQMLAAKDSAD